ncbi:hypothetical protein BLNAU_9358 [Blattamonas nauphoetae]|uniref:Protein kinase domain-containing protein n=1 Tax=Blattamonas nauphoetae TaxID=2049346 RepID=A0ABQ9XW06_9EUKA|nr:hypothetical protein BLNAU_9358 [Blattamonas nauphoetae]
MFLLLCSMLHCVDEHYQDFDAIYETKLAEPNLASNSESMHLSFDFGLYWTNGIDIVSKSVELHGNKTWLTHRANVQNERNGNTDESTMQTATKLNHPERWMMEVRNSSLTMRSFGLDAGMTGTTICLVVGSSVEVIDSELLSNMECSGFVLADCVGSGSSRIVIVGSSHKSSTQNVVLPLVGRGHGQLSTHNEEWKRDEEGCGDGCVEREEIIGVGLSFDSTHFGLGTGPLFSFVGKSLWSGSGGEKIGMVGEISTELRSSDILNVTSSFEFGEGSKTGLGVGSCVWERVVGSKILGSTNHDMGTGLCGARLGFNVVCVNSSFSSCVRTSNADIDMKHKNITSTNIKRTYVTLSFGATMAKVTLCTFNDMTIAAGNNWAGAAICLHESKSSLNVTQCFFHKCTVTAQGDDGGAICVWEYVEDRPITISLSSFTECANTGTSGNYGGSMYFQSPSHITIADCFFETCQSHNVDGAFGLNMHSLATLSNCAFVACSAKYGGAFEVYKVSKIDFSFLQFRGCSATDKKSSDIYFNGAAMTTEIVTEDSFKFCDSTSARPNVYMTQGKKDLSHLVPELSSTPTVEVSVLISGDTATVTATAYPAVKGTMGILLKGSNVPRLVHVQFWSDSGASSTGTAVVSSGADGVLPPAEKYEHRSSSMATGSFPPTSLHAADSSLSTDGNTAEIVLIGANLGEGSYSMLIRNGEDTFNISLTRNDSTTLVGEAPLHPLEAPERLEWSTEYSVEKVIWLPQGGIEEEINLINTLTFKTPAEPLRILSYLSSSITGTKDELTISFMGSLPNGELGTIKVKQSDSDILVEGVLTRDSLTQCTAVFSTTWTENTTHLSFGKTYSVQSAVLSSIVVAVSSGITFDVPNPAVITSFSIPTECSSDSFDFEVIGQNLPSPATYTLTLSGPHTMSITFSESTKGKGTVKASLPSEMEFGTTYSVLSVTKGDDHVLFLETSFTTPPGPTLLSISTSLTLPLKKEVKLSLNGLRMMAGDFTLTFVEQRQSTPLNIPVTITSETSGSGSSVIFDGSILKYGTTYEVKSLTSTKLHFAIAPSLTFTVEPEPSRLTKYLSSSITGTKDELTISFVGSLLPDGIGTIQMKQAGSDVVVEGVLTRVTETECRGVISTAWKEDATHMSFGKTYSVKSAKIDSKEIVVDSGISVPVPTPAVITSFSVPTECSSDSFDVSVVGENFPHPAMYTLTLSDSHTISVTFSSDTKGKGTVKASLPSAIQFSTTYSVSSVVNGDDHVLLNATTLTTPPGPTLLSISTSLTLPLKKEVTLSLSGLRMKSGEFNLTFQKQGTTTPLNITVTITSETEGSGSEDIFGGTILEYGTTYEVLSLTSTTLHFAIAPSLTFTTDPEPPRLTSISYDGLSDKDRKADFTVGGRVMTNGENYTIIVNKTGTAVQKKFEVRMSSAEVGGGSAVLFSQTEGEIELDYDTEYEVVGVKDSSQSPILFEGGLTFTTGAEPARLVSFSIVGYDKKEKEVRFEMKGRVLDTSAMMKVGLSISSELKHTVSMKFDSTKQKWEGSAILFSLGGCELEYGKTYTVSSFRKGEETDELFFETNEITIGSEPSRLAKITRNDDSGLNSTTLTLSSRVLSVGEKYEVKVTGTPLSSSNANHETTFTFTASSSTLNTVPLTLYPFEDAILEYGHSYCVDWMKVVGGASIFVEPETCGFKTPTEPARIYSSTGAILSKDRTNVTISLEGRALGDPLGSIWVSVGDTFWESSTMRKISETLCEATFLVSPEGDGTHLKYKGEYTVCLKPDEPSSLLVDSGITVHIPAPPRITEVKFSFTNSLGTGCIAILTGTDLVVGTEYSVKLNTSHTFSIVVKSSTLAESSEMLIGFEGALAYSADILIDSVEPTDEESGDVLIPSPSFIGQTQARPNVNEIFVDTETGNNDWTCGNSSRPCSTMDAAWKIMRTLDISQPTFSLLKGTSLSSQMTIESGMSVLMQNGSHREPSLNIPSSAAESATSALIVVSSAFLNIQNIDIVVGSSNPSFVLISASSSEMILKDGLITITSSTTESRNEMEELCLWTTGLIELIDTELNVTNNELFNISQGAIRMKGGRLNIQGSIFKDNSPNDQDFPSARRNVACSESGIVHVGSLTAGDGSPLHPSAWISSDGCSIDSTEIDSHAPLFIPTLSSDSTSKLDKKTKSFSLTIEGTILIPCSLFLEVFEMRKDGTEVNSTQIHLTVDSATSFSETKIVITLPSSSLKSLDDSLEWRGRLVFGENQTTTNSFLIQLSSSGRFAQAVKDNMKWWIPLVVVVSCALLAVILIVVLLMRRRNKNEGRNDGNQQELDQTDDKIDVMSDGDINDNPNLVATTSQKQLHGISTHRSQSDENTAMMSTPAHQAAVLIVGEDQFGQPKIEDGFVNPHDTLFNRLHGREEKTELNIYRTRLDVAKAVATLLSLRPNAVALQKLNPHWVLFTPSNSICFKLNDDTPSQAPTTIPTQSGAPKETQEEKRWSAPEEENRCHGIDEQKVTVFRLGLILWEITTGQVPFSETDAVNAQRQLKIGVVPRMDSIEPAELAILLLECLDLNPHSRPSLESLVSRLEKIREGMNEEAGDLLELQNHQLEPKQASHVPSQD